MRILVYDGNALASRMRWAQKNLVTSDNRRSGVVYGFLQNFNWVRGRLNLDRSQVFVVWDGGRSAFRREKLPTYKARKPPDDEVEFHEYLAQLDALHKNLNTFGIRGQLKLKGIEADDLISALAHEIKASGNTPIVYSGDRDLHQLADIALIFDPVRNMLTTEDILALHGVTKVEHIPLLKALQGDKSDNIPGVAGVGEVRAKKILPHVLKHFGFDAPATDLDSLGESTRGWIQKVIDSQEIVQRNLEMIRLPKSFEEVRDLQEGQLDEIATALSHKPDVDHIRMAQFLRDWECQTLLDRL